MFEITGKIFGAFSRSKVSKYAIPVFQNIYKISLDEYLIKKSGGFSSLDEFFVRQIDPKLRPLHEKSFMISPVDAYLRSAHITNGTDFFVQAKDKTYPLSLIIGEKLPPNKKYFYCSLYLAPHNYHCIHVPMDCQIQETKFLGTSRYPVNDFSVNFIDKLFFKNYRSVTKFTANGLMGWISAIAAYNVSSIEVCVKDHQPAKKGDLYGKFHLGSSVVIVMEVPDSITQKNLREPGPIKFGEPLILQ